MHFWTKRAISRKRHCTHINSLRAFFGWLTMEEKIKKNPMSKIKSIKIDKEEHARR